MKKTNRLLQFFKYEYCHYKDPRNTSEYKARKRIVRDWWIYFGVIAIVLLQFPNLLGIICAGAIAVTFLSFSFLDEWKHFRENQDSNE